MGECVYCHQKAGFLRRKHKECLEKFNNGSNEIVSLVSESIVKGIGKHQTQNRLEGIASNSFIDAGQRKKLIANGWESALNSALDDDFLSSEEEGRLGDAKDEWALSQDDLNENGAYTRLVQSSVLREILDGKLPDRMKLTGDDVPFNFQKGEKLIWIFQNVDYYEDKTRRQYVGGHHGASIRVAKGLYYRVGSFKGEPVNTTETVHVSNGILGITNKHLYYYDGVKPFRVKYDKIVSFSPKSNGIGIQRDAVTAKPQSFDVGDGWFVYNLVTNLANMEK